MKKAISILSFTLILLSSCKKKVDALPDATQSGAHTFGAKLDGEFWVPQSFGPFHDPSILEGVLVSNHDIYIYAKNFSKSPNETEFEIYIKNAQAPGTYPLNTDLVYPSTGGSYAYFIKRNINPVDEFLTSASAGGSVTITKIDTVNRFVSGTFSFQAKSIYDPTKIINVTEGRFDVKTN